MNRDQSESVIRDDVISADQSESVIDDDPMHVDQSELVSSNDVTESKQTNSIDPPPDFQSTSRTNTMEFSDDISNQLDQMIERLSLSDAHFKHQQRDEPDLTPSEKSHIARNLFHKHPIKFLTQFSKHLKFEDIPCFKFHYPNNATIEVYITELEKSLRTKSKRIIMNRRYQAMRTKTEEGSYFSEEEMRHRDPYLYHQMIGQYLKEDERPAREIDRSDHRFSTVLMEFMNKCDDDQLYQAAKEKEEEVEEETDSEDEEEEDENKMATNEASAAAATSSESVPDVTDEERTLLRHEFLHIMQERFMAGQDRDFDYSSVDSNADYDPLDIRGQDEEERYFDEMEPELASGGASGTDDTLDSDSECWTKPRKDTGD